MSPKLTKTPPKTIIYKNTRFRYPFILWGSDFSGSDADSDDELEIFVASKHNCDVKLSKPL